MIQQEQRKKTKTRKFSVSVFSVRASGYEMAMGSSCYAFFPNTEENWDDALVILLICLFVCLLVYLSDVIFYLRGCLSLTITMSISFHLYVCLFSSLFLSLFMFMSVSFNLNVCLFSS